MHFDLELSRQRIQAMQQEAAQELRASQARVPREARPRPQLRELLRQLRPA